MFALEPAFGLDDQVMDLCELLSSGARPVLIGESGVGKTAAVHEFAARLEATVREHPSDWMGWYGRLSRGRGGDSRA